MQRAILSLLVVFLCLSPALVLSSTSFANCPSGTSASLVFTGDVNTGTTQVGAIVNPDAIAVNADSTYIFIVNRVSNTSEIVSRYTLNTLGIIDRSSEVVFGTIGANLSTAVYGLALDSSDNLFAVDTGNNRVLVYYFATKTKASRNTLTPDQVIGQSDFSTTSVPSTPTASSLNSPYDLCLEPAADRLWVVDTFNSRVLRFDSILDKSNGTAANGVLGVPDFTTNITSNTTIALTATTLDFPVGCVVAPTSGDLFVYDYHRIVRYDSAASKANGAAANVVFANSDFVGTVTFAINGYGLQYDEVNDILFAGAISKNAVYLFLEATATTTNGAAPTIALGQNNLTSNSTNQGNTSPSINTLSGPSYLAYNALTGFLYVADSDNQRIVEYHPCAGSGSVAPSTTVSTSASRISVSNSESRVSVTVTNSAGISPSVTTSANTVSTSKSPGISSISITTTGGRTTGGSTGLRRKFRF